MWNKKYRSANQSYEFLMQLGDSPSQGCEIKSSRYSTFYTKWRISTLTAVHDLIVLIILLLFYLQTSMISLDNLTKAIEPTQLTREFEGGLDYNHEQWIQLRLVTTLPLHNTSPFVMPLLPKTTPHIKLDFRYNLCVFIISIHMNVGTAKNK